MEKPNIGMDATRWTLFSTLMRVVLQLLQISVLARFLSPADYGLMAMVSVVLSYASLLADVGLSAAFVQREKVSHEERSSLYWLNVVVGAALMLLIITVSPLVAIYFKSRELIPLVILAATNFLVVALGQQLRVDAEKSLNFRPIALIEIISCLVGFFVAVLAAWEGWGVYALVLSAMASAWLAMIMSWLLLAKGWRPELRFHWGEVRWFVRFGGVMVLNNIINHVNVTVDLVLGGRMLGASQLGLYSMPRNLILQVQGAINPIFTRVGFPLIASVQNDKQNVKQIYLQIMNMTASVNAPIYVAIAFFAPEIVWLMLGANWVEAAPLMRVLALWGLLRSFANPLGSLLVGVGRLKLSLIWNVSLLLIVPPAVWYGAQWGAVGMAWAMLTLMAMIFVPAWAILVRPTCGAGLCEYAKQVLKPTLCAISSGVFAWIGVNVVEKSLLRLMIGIGISVVFYFIFSLWFNRAAVEFVKSAIKKPPSTISV